MPIEKLKNDRAIILAKQYKGDVEVLIALLPNNENTPFVTWKRQIGADKESTYLGHYFMSLTEAYNDWRSRFSLHG